jgi:TonB family protein
MLHSTARSTLTHCYLVSPCLLLALCGGPGVAADSSAPALGSLPTATQSAAPASSQSSAPSSALLPQPETTESIETAAYRPPRIKNLVAADYPGGYARREGWVVVSTMVDPQGRPYEAAVASSTGAKELEKAALAAIEKTGFEPAISDGKPVDSVFHIKYYFSFSNPGEGASAQFVSAYKKLSDALRKEDRAGAAEALNNLKVVNLYEDAFLGLAQYSYASKYGSVDEQIAGLQRAIAGEQRAKYLTHPEFEGAVRQSLILDLKANRLSEAEERWAQLQRIALDKKNLLSMKPTMDMVDALKSDPRPIYTAGVLPPTADDDGASSSSWSLGLFRHKFSLNVTYGTVADIKVRCDKTFLRFKYDPQIVYHVESRFGNCGMAIIGEPGTQFTVIQSL